MDDLSMPSAYRYVPTRTSNSTAPIVGWCWIYENGAWRLVPSN